MVSFLRSNFVLTLLLVVSVVVLVVGLTLVNHAPAVTQARPAVQTQDNIDYEIPSLPELDTNPPVDLDRVQLALKELSKGVVPVGQVFDPAALAEAQANADVGSEMWCDILLLKPDADWTDLEAEQFAQSCI